MGDERQREITVDGEIEPSTISKLSFHLKLCANGPDMFRAKSRLRSVTLFAAVRPKLPRPERSRLFLIAAALTG
jgi:hypothetical protein